MIVSTQLTPMRPLTVWQRDQSTSPQLVLFVSAVREATPMRNRMKAMASPIKWEKMPKMTLPLKERGERRQLGSSEGSGSTDAATCSPPSCSKLAEPVTAVGVTATRGQSELTELQ